MEAQDIVSKNIMLFHYIADAIYTTNRDELFSELCLLFVQDFRKWKREYSLGTFLSLLIKRAHGKCKKQKDWGEKHFCVTEDFLKIFPERAPINHYDSDKLLRIINTTLNKKERICVIEKFYNNKSLQVLSDILGVSRQNCSEMMLKALDKLFIKLKGERDENTLYESTSID